MSEIPEDVAVQARQTWNKIMNNSYRDGSIVISQAILAERDRCAKIAEDKAVGYEDEAEAAWECSKPIAVRLRGVSQAIRRR